MATLPGAVAGARIVGERFVRSRRRQNPEGRMPLIEHLRELRTRIVKMALALPRRANARRPTRTRREPRAPVSLALSDEPRPVR